MKTVYFSFLKYLLKRRGITTAVDTAQDNNRKTATSYDLADAFFGLFQTSMIENS